MTNIQFFWLNAQIFHLLSGHALDATLSATIKTKIVTNVLPQLKHPAWLGTRYVAGFYLYDVLHRLGFLFFSRIIRFRALFLILMSSGS